MKKKYVIISFLILLGLTVFAYRHAFQAPFHYDDHWHIVENPRLRSARGAIGLLLKFNKGLTNLSYALNYMTGGMEASGFHLVNVVIHLFNGIVLYFFLRFTLGLACVHDWFNKHKRILSLSAAGLFLLHPVHTEAVTYVFQRSTLLVFSFYLFTILAYGKGRVSETRRLSRLYFAAAAVSAILALMSKANAAMLPLSVLLYELYFFRNFRLNKKHIAAILIILLFLAAFPLVMGRDTVKEWSDLYRERGFTPAERVLTQSRVLVYYLALMTYPSPERLTPAYDFEKSTSPFSPPATFFSILLLAGLFAAAVAAAKKHRLFSFFIIWFFVNSAIESSPVPLIMVFEHRLYLPSAGLFFIAAAVIIYIAQKGTDRIQGVKKAGMTQICACLLLIPVLIPLTLWTSERNFVWKDEKRLWLDAVEKSPGSATAHTMLGFVLSRENDIRGAAEEFHRAVEINPLHAVPRANLGLNLLMLGRIEEAEKAVRRAIELEPRSAKNRESLAAVLLFKGEPEKARRELELAVEFWGGYTATIHVNMGYIEMREGNYMAAESHFLKAIKLSPSEIKAHENLGRLYILTGRTDQGIEKLKSAYRMSGAGIDYRHIAELLLSSGKSGRAAGLLGKALEGNPRDTGARIMLARIYTMNEDFSNAEKILKKGSAYSENPDPEILNALGMVYISAGNGETAVPYFEKAVKLDPSNLSYAYNLASAHENTGRREEALTVYRKIAGSPVPGYENLKEEAERKLNGSG